MLDAAGKATTDKALRVKNTYEIILLKMIADVSTNSIQAVKVDTTSALAVTLPANHQKSGVPITGKF